MRGIVSPATPEIFNQALEEGIIKIFMDAGFCVTNPTCGACLGMSNGVLAEGEVCASTTNRNFYGRMGKGGMVHLMSPATAAATAIAGYITNSKLYKGRMHTTMKQFNGKVLFLDRSDINTDEIIPAKYLTEISKEALKPHLLEDLKLSTFDPKKDINGKSIVVTRSNFGCGSSREHAPWALEVNGINLVIGESFARIFRQNMFNCGMMAVELRKKHIDQLFQEFSNKDTIIETDLAKNRFVVTSGSMTAEFSIFNIRI